MASTNRGTPTTLTRAIKNGIEDYGKDREGETEAHVVEHIRKNVADFIRNGIGPAHLVNENDEVADAIDKFISKLM